MVESSPWPIRFNYPYRLTHETLTCAVVCYKWSCAPFVKWRTRCLSFWLMTTNRSPTAWDGNLTRQMTMKMTLWYSIRNSHEPLSCKFFFVFNYTLKPDFRIRACHTSRKTGGLRGSDFWTFGGTDSLLKCIPPVDWWGRIYKKVSLRVSLFLYPFGSHFCSRSCILIFKTDDLSGLFAPEHFNILN